MHPVQLELLAKAHIEELGRRPARLLRAGAGSAAPSGAPPDGSWSTWACGWR